MFYYTIQVFAVTFFLQTIFFKFFKLKKYWVILSIFFIIISFIFVVIIYNYFLFDFFIYNLVIAISYILFLTGIFNESPTIVAMEVSKEEFMKRKFVENRLNLMKKNKLIDNNNLVTKNGIFFYKIINKLSDSFFNED